MYNSNIPTNQEIPSTGKLIKSTVIAAVTALILLVTVVMPAEYGIDHTGIGEAIGLKKMGEIRVSLAEEAADDRAKELAQQSQEEPEVQEVIVVKEDDITQITKVKPPQQIILEHEMTVTLAPNQGTEIKLSMLKGNKVNYSWVTDGGKANFDVHGDSKELKINYHSYSKGSKIESDGVIKADFDGSHGWFWRNRTSETMTITLKTNGEYTSIKHFK